MENKGSKTYRQEYYAKHKEQLRENARKWNHAHKERNNERKRAYNRKNPDKVAEWNLRTALRKVLAKKGILTETGRVYLELDGIRLVFDDAELIGWYNPYLGLEVE